VLREVNARPAVLAFASVAHPKRAAAGRVHRKSHFHPPWIPLGGAGHFRNLGIAPSSSLAPVSGMLVRQSTGFLRSGVDAVLLPR
jgi:hypothetical protein